MTEIKRYDFGVDGFGEGTPFRNDNDGRVVFYEDHAAEVARLNEQARYITADRDEWERRAKSNFEACSRLDVELRAATRTLDSLNYTYHGGQLWKPPIGPVPKFDLMEKKDHRISELEEQVRALAADGDTLLNERLRMLEKVEAQTLYIVALELRYRAASIRPGRCQMPIKTTSCKVECRDCGYTCEPSQIDKCDKCNGTNFLISTVPSAKKFIPENYRKLDWDEIKDIPIGSSVMVTRNSGELVEGILTNHSDWMVGFPVVKTSGGELIGIFYYGEIVKEVS